MDEAKRKVILALLTNGSSRRVAAAYVGCSPGTITRTALRDPDFAAELARAENHAEVEALRALREAARKDRYWRAAAWILERKNPDDFAPRKPNVVTEEQLWQVLGMMAEYLLQDLSEENYRKIMRRLKRAAIEEAISTDKKTPTFGPINDDSTPSAGSGFSTDPTRELCKLRKCDSPHVIAYQIVPHINIDANQTQH